MLFSLFWAVSLLSAAPANQDPAASTAQVLCAAYPSKFKYADGALLWDDATRMPLDDARPKRFAEKLDTPDLEDQLSIPYPKNWLDTPPKPDEDPGRIRFDPFFAKLYGATREEVSARLTPVSWLPAAQPATIDFNREAGAAGALAEVARDLQTLPKETQAYVIKPIGSFNFRPIAGTQRLSPHSYGIAVDFQLPKKLYCYWQWGGKSESAPPPYPPALLTDPQFKAVVQVFEKHGFIWGGKWAHFDSMHFEYRPELIQN